MQPVNIPKDWDGYRSAISVLYNMPDNENYGLKMSKGFIIGGKVGIAGGIANVLLTPNLTFEEIVYKRKMWTTMQLSRGFLVGATSGCLYVGTAQLVSKLRGDKDDLWNHFAGAFGGILPYTILYKQTWRFFLLGGIIYGTLAAIVKLGSQNEMFKTLYRLDRTANNPTKYHEIYMHTQVMRDKEEEKRKLQYLEELKHQ